MPLPQQVQQLLLKLEAFKDEQGKYPASRGAGRELYKQRARLLEKKDLTTAEREDLKKTQQVTLPLPQQVQDCLSEMEAFKDEHGK